MTTTNNALPPITRLVKMHFAADKTTEFLALFAGVKDLIAAFEGCRHLELWRDTTNPCIFFTHSIWQSKTHLEQYRQSELFQATWAVTKTFFAAPPQAWSLENEY